MSYYAVAKGKKPGIYTNWAECEKNIKGYSGAKYKKFDTEEEAENFINTFKVEPVKGVVENDTELYAVIIAPDGLIDIMKKEELDEINKNYPVGITSLVKSREDAIDYFKKNSDIYDFYIERFVRNNKLFDEKRETYSKQRQGNGEKHSNIIISDKAPMEDFTVLKDKEAIVYVDGSYKEDLNDFTYGIVIIDSNGEEIEFSGRSLSHEKSLKEMRNVSGELKGTIVAIKKAIELGFEKIYLHYDYQGIESWVTGEWKAKKEGTKMYRDTINFLLQDIKIEFIKVKGHSGIRYNERVDQLAAMAYFDY